jgi:hypothetical protein
VGRLGRKLVGAATEFAWKAGYRRMRLWTHREHEAAGRLCSREGLTGGNCTEPCIQADSHGRNVGATPWTSPLSEPRGNLSGHHAATVLEM